MFVNSGTIFCVFFFNSPASSSVSLSASVFFSRSLFHKVIIKIRMSCFAVALVTSGLSVSVCVRLYECLCVSVCITAQFTLSPLSSCLNPSCSLSRYFFFASSF
uniref:Putative secreted protein n=1 Tax=Psorophora albipes TaxID=869069 RepID=T1DJ60_9DIPT